MIDLHFHVLPGIDDGPDTIDDAVALARAAKQAGVDTIVATPHVSLRYPNTAEVIAGKLAVLSARLSADGVEVEVLPGAEIAATRLLDIAPAELPKLGLGGGPWLLVEPPITSTADGLDTIVGSLLRAGHHVLLAHPERCSAFHRDPQMLETLVRSGVITSVTAGSLVGRFGSRVRRFALAMADAEIIHNVTSDSHDLDGRRPGTEHELESAGLSLLGEWLTEAVPRAILDGEETVPRRPATASLRGPGAPKPRAWAIRRWLKQAS